MLTRADRAGVISKEDGLRSGLDDSFVQRADKYGGGFLVNVEGMHHLHCLVSTSMCPFMRMELTLRLRISSGKPCTSIMTDTRRWAITRGRTKSASSVCTSVSWHTMLHIREMKYPIHSDQIDQHTASTRYVKS